MPTLIRCSSSPRCPTSASGGSYYRRLSVCGAGRARVRDRGCLRVASDVLPNRLPTIGIRKHFSTASLYLRVPQFGHVRLA
jgi:hypothetical protein